MENKTKQKHFHWEMIEKTSKRRYLWRMGICVFNSVHEKQQKQTCEILNKQQHTQHPLEDLLGWKKYT